MPPQTDSSSDKEEQIAHRDENPGLAPLDFAAALMPRADKSSSSANLPLTRTMSTIDCHRPASPKNELNGLLDFGLFKQKSNWILPEKNTSGSQNSVERKSSKSSIFDKLQELLSPGPKEIKDNEPLPKLTIAGKTENYPRSKKMDYVDSYKDREIADPYQWLENTKDPETKDWVKKQTELTERYLAGIPEREELKRRLDAIYNFETRFDMFKHEGKYYFWKQDGRKEQPEFCVADDFHGKPRVILDPNKLSENGHGIVRDLKLSKDGNYASFRFADGGQDATVNRYFDLKAQKLIDRLPEGQDSEPRHNCRQALMPDGSKRTFYLSDESAPLGKLLYWDKEKKEQTVIPETTDKLLEAFVSGDKILAHYLNDACSSLKVFDLAGKFQREIELPGRGTVKSIYASASDKELLFTYSDFRNPSTIYRADTDSGKIEAHFKPQPAFNPADFVTEEKFCKSKDGTPVHLFITHKKDLVQDGKNPAYLHGYGGFRINRGPQFDAGMLPWLQDGGLYVVANLRGGSEYGENWHQAGMGQNKQNVFDDFISSAQYLIDNKYTSGKRLAIGGRSNGGLLVGATLVQRPDLFAAAIPEVGLFDMLRFPKLGPGRAWEPEYGYPANPADLKNFLKYSPLHNLKRGVGLPAVLTMTNVNDDRVLPAHSFKFTAAAQQAQAEQKKPVLLYVGQNRGHGPEKFRSALVDEYSSKWAFLKQAMGLVPDK